MWWFAVHGTSRLTCAHRSPSKTKKQKSCLYDSPRRAGVFEVFEEGERCERWVRALHWIQCNYVRCRDWRVRSHRNRQAVDVPFEIHMICDARFHTKLFNERSVAAAAAACDEVSVRTLIFGANNRSGADAFTAKTLTSTNELLEKLPIGTRSGLRSTYALFLDVSFLWLLALIWIQFNGVRCVSECVDPTTANGSDNMMPVTVHAACDLPHIVDSNCVRRRTDVGSLNSKCAHEYRAGATKPGYYNLRKLFVVKAWSEAFKNRLRTNKTAMEND